MSVELFSGLHLARRLLLVPGTVAAEVRLAARNASANVESLFFRALAHADLQPVDLQAGDDRRAGQPVQTGNPLPIPVEPLRCSPFA